MVFAISERQKYENHLSLLCDVRFVRRRTKFYDVFPVQSLYQHVPGKPKNEKGTIPCIVDIFTIQEGKISQYRQWRC